jgi:MFS family permease
MGKGDNMEKSESRADNTGKRKSGTPGNSPASGNQKKPISKSKNDADEGSFERYRYLIRILKGAFLPVLYVVVSIFMLRKYVYEFTNYYQYDVLMILAGVLVGIFAMSGMTVFNIIRARDRKKEGVKIDNTLIIAVYVPLILILVILALVFGLSTVWQFSIGFFVTSIIPPLIVLLGEVTSKGKFYVLEREKPKKMLKLVLVPNPPE